MFSALKNLFKGRPSFEESLYSIEVNDEEINKSLIKIINKLQEGVKVLKTNLGSESSIEKDQQLQDLFEQILEVKESAKELSLHVEKIIEIEMNYKEYFIIKDDTFLLDKRQQLKMMMDSIGMFLEIVQQKPSIIDLRDELFQKLVDSLNAISGCINRILKDDASLRIIYKTIKKV